MNWCLLVIGVMAITNCGYVGNFEWPDEKSLESSLSFKTF